jgi:hypothetical protein
MRHQHARDDPPNPRCRRRRRVRFIRRPDRCTRRNAHHAPGSDPYHHAVPGRGCAAPLTLFELRSYHTPRALPPALFDPIVRGEPPMQVRRRAVLHAGAAAAIATPASQAASRASSSAEPVLDTVPALPSQPSPGKPGEFDFLAGQWRIEHWRRPPGAPAWDRFTGEATCRTILGGVGSVEELRIPARGFAGMGLRLLDVAKREWSDFWVNAGSGVLTTPGQNGSFENGVGLFWSDYEDAGRKMRSAGIWDQITPRSCRWRQVVSDDGGKTWEHNWVMLWRRV